MIVENNAETAGTNEHKVGKIDLDIYKCVSEDIITDEVIITDNQIQHIIERRGKEFYNEYKDRFSEIVADPDYIFKDDRENTAIVSKSYYTNGKNINLILRLIVEGDDPNYKNSIITAIGENKKRFEQRYACLITTLSRAALGNQGGFLMHISSVTCKNVDETDRGGVTKDSRQKKSTSSRMKG